jgi:glycosyltransferase involved in cell wall biosynthesis
VKITFVIPQDSLAGGIRAVSIYADQLQKRGHDVTVVAGVHPPKTYKEKIRRFLLQSRQRQSTVSTTSSSYFDVLDVHLHTLEEHRPVRDSDLPDADVVIATWWETAEWIAPLSASKGKKVYFIQHHEVFDYLPESRVEATYRLPFYQITVAQWLVEILRDRHHSQQVSLVPYGVDLKQFNSVPRPKAATPTVGLMYATAAWKGVDIALQAFQYALKDLPGLRLVAFGSEQPSAQLPLPKNTQYYFKPEQACIKDIYAQCDAWLFSSRVEGFGLPILEAMACHTPVIAVPTGAAPELLSNGCGMLLDRNDPMLIAQAIHQMAKLDVVEWQQLSEHAYQTACQRSWEDAAHDFEAALLQAIATQ